MAGLVLAQTQGGQIRKAVQHGIAATGGFAFQQLADEGCQCSRFALQSAQPCAALFRFQREGLIQQWR
jgi:hypothetical protein